MCLVQTHIFDIYKYVEQLNMYVQIELVGDQPNKKEEDEVKATMRIFHYRNAANTTGYLQ